MLEVDGEVSLAEHGATLRLEGCLSFAVHIRSRHGHSAECDGNGPRFVECRDTAHRMVLKQDSYINILQFMHTWMKMEL